MSFNNKFVVCILKDGQVCTEFKARGGYPEVRLPEGTEYGIRLRNKHDRRAVGEVVIDGESQGAFVIPAHDYVDIFRPGHKDAAFKLVGTDSQEAADYGKNSNCRPNGTVVVKFRLEKQYRPHVALSYSDYSPFQYTNGVRWDAKGPTRSLMSFKANLSSSIDREVPTAGGIEMGVTVEGERTGQQFGSASLDLEFTETTVGISLVIEKNDLETLRRVMKEAVNSAVRKSAAISSKFCVECGTQRRQMSDKFCVNCGNKF